MLPSLAGGQLFYFNTYTWTDEVKRKPKQANPPDFKVTLPKISAALSKQKNFINLFLVNDDTLPSNNVEKIQKFSQINGRQQQRRKEYLRTTGLEAAIRRQIQLYENRVAANGDSSRLCDGLASRYDRGLEKAFSSLVADFASKSFELSCTMGASECDTRESDGVLCEIRDLEEKKEDRRWRIKREMGRIARADEMLMELGEDTVTS